MSSLVGVESCDWACCSSSSGLGGNIHLPIGYGAVGLPEGSSGVADHRGVVDFMDSPHV